MTGAIRGRGYRIGMNRISGWANALLVAFFIVCAFISLYPLLLVLGISLTKNEALLDGYSIIPKIFSLEGYKFAFGTSNAILRAYGVTIFVTVIGTIVHVCICTLFAYPLSRPEFRSHKVIMGVLIVPMLFSGGVIPWYVINVQVLRLRNTIWAMILPLLFSPWDAIVLRTFIKNNIHPSLLESARLDGCSEFKALTKIVLPLSKAGIAVIAFFTALYYWNDYWLSLMLITDEMLYSLQYLLYNIMAKIQFLSSLAAQQAGISLAEVGAIPQETTRMALCILTIGPIILAYPFFQRFFVRGITIGAIKG